MPFYLTWIYKKGHTLWTTHHISKNWEHVFYFQYKVATGRCAFDTLLDPRSTKVRNEIIREANAPVCTAKCISRVYNYHKQLSEPTRNKQSMYVIWKMFQRLLSAQNDFVVKLHHKNFRRATF